VYGPLDILLQAGRPVEDDVAGGIALEGVFPDDVPVEALEHVEITRKILEGKGHRFGPPQPANHLAIIIIGAPSLTGKPVGNNRFYGANDPRRNTGLAGGY
jgi:gamma-glutamyltranspeptidase/glutathione hydrolase